MHEQLESHDSFDSNPHGEDDFSALMRAIEKKDLPVVQSLVDKGADINSQEEYGDTALMRAVEAKNLPIVKFLVDKGADINFQEEYGDTALMRAIEAKDLPVVKFLVDKGADINLSGENGDTVCVRAMKQSSLPILAFLVDKGAHIRLHGEDGYKALMEAVEKKDTDIVRFLITEGVDVNLHGEDGATVLQNVIHSLNQTVLAHTEAVFIEISKILVRSGASTYLPQNIDILDSIQDEGLKVFLKGLRGTLHDSILENLSPQMIQNYSGNKIPLLEFCLQIVPQIYTWKRTLLRMQNTLDKMYCNVPEGSRIFQTALLPLQIARARRYQHDPFEAAKRVVEQQALCFNKDLLKNFEERLSRTIERSSCAFFKNVPNRKQYDGKKFIERLVSLPPEIFSMLIWPEWRDYLSSFLENRVSETNKRYIDFGLEACFKPIYQRERLETVLAENNRERQVPSPMKLS